MIKVVELVVIKKNKITFSGNVDPSGVIALGTPDMVEEKTKEVLDLFKDYPRLIMNAGCAIPAETPSENIKRFIEVSRNYGWSWIFTEVSLRKIIIIHH